MASAHHGKFVWNELMTDDVEGAKAFYGKVAGWTYKDLDMPGMAYTLCFQPGATQAQAGMMHWPADQPGGRDWFAYIAVDAIEALIADVTAAGGELLRPVFEVPGTGRIAIVKDAVGSVIGFIEPAPM